jgi:hypothetical protein
MMSQSLRASVSNAQSAAVYFDPRLTRKTAHPLLPCLSGTGLGRSPHLPDLRRPPGYVLYLGIIFNMTQMYLLYPSVAFLLTRNLPQPTPSRTFTSASSRHTSPLPSRLVTLKSTSKSSPPLSPPSLPRRPTSPANCPPTRARRSRSKARPPLARPPLSRRAGSRRKRRPPLPTKFPFLFSFSKIWGDMGGKAGCKCRCN